MLLELFWLATLGLDTIPVGAYIMYMSKIAKTRPWNIKMDPNYEPRVSVLIPTFEEETTIRRKLNNVAEVDYPKAKLEIVIVDSASGDRTVDRIREWSTEHSEVKVTVVVESERRGMVRALNKGLHHTTGEVVVKTDADCLWLKDSLRNLIKYITDPSVGSVAGLHIIDAVCETSPVVIEKIYRNFYRSLRIGESKLYGTVLYEGELMLLKRALLAQIGFDEDIGADDVPIALRMAENGYRAITADDAFFVEQTPYTWKTRFLQKIRRGRHVVQSLWKYRHLNFRDKTAFHRMILPFETYIYVVNPIITLIAVLLSVGMIIRHPWIALSALVLLVPSIRQLLATHLVNSLTMVIVILKEATRRESATWQKISEIREPLESGDPQKTIVEREARA